MVFIKQIAMQKICELSKKKFFLFLKRHLEIETGIDEAKNKQKKCCFQRKTSK